MSTVPTPEAARPARRALALAAGVAVVLALLRSLVFVLYEGANFDSDQAVFGLMSKHLAEGSAFPLFMYGQRYLLGVFAWLGAPCVALLGPTVTAAKLPVLAANLVVAGLLVTRLVRDAELAPRFALVSGLPFLLPPVAVTALLTQSMGGNIEPFLYVLLLWVLRRHPIAFGLVAGLGYLNREFTVYGVLALLGLQAVRGDLARPEARSFWLRAGLAAAAVLLAVHFLQPYSTNATTRGANVAWRGFDAARTRLLSLLDANLRILYGLQPVRLSDFNVRSALTTGRASPIMAPVAAAVALWLSVRLACTAWRARALVRSLDLPLYLLLIGAQSLVVYVLLGRGLGSPLYVRYILLGLLAPAGALALLFRLDGGRVARATAVAVVTAWAAMNGLDHLRIAHEYATGHPEDRLRVLADHLVKRGIRYGASDYWVAYHVTYLSGERVRLDARGFPRILEYRRLFREHLAEAVDVRRAAGEPCVGGEIVAGWCVVGPPAPLRRRPRPDETPPPPAATPPSSR